MSVLKSELVFETAIITTFRLGLFYFCRTYLLRSLYHDLRVLSSQSLSPSTTSAPISLEPLSAFPSSSSSPGMLSPDLSDMEREEEHSLLPSPSVTPRRKSRTFTWPPRRMPNASIVASKEGTFQSTLSRTTFATCFSESCVLFLVVMLQATRTFGSRTRLLNWNISLTVLICLILLVIPLLQCIFITYRPSPTADSTFITRQLGRRLILTLIPYILYLAAVYRIPVPEALTDADFITTSLSRLTVIGVLILGLISGYGCISTAFMFFADIVRSDSVEPTQAEILLAEQSVYRVRADLLERRQEVDKRQAQQESSAAEPSRDGVGGGWLQRLPSFLGGGDTEASGLAREIAGLEMLEREMANDVKQLKMRKSRMEFSRTWKGKLWKWIGWAFGAYCVFRILSSLLNLILPRRLPTDASPSTSVPPRRTPDLIAGFLTYTLSLIPLPSSMSFLHSTSPDQVAAISRQVSLVLVGCIVLVSVRGVLRGIGRVLKLMSGGSTTGKKTSEGGGGSGRSLMANFMLLVLAQVLGLYLLSTLIQLRNSFPPGDDAGSGEGVAALFASLPSYEVFNALFDWAFLISAALTAGGRWIGNKAGLR